ncbi:MAG: LysR substrate-binding domain-containing protein [Pseudomonadota bacterium]
MGEAATLISMVAEGKSQEVTGEVTVTATDLLSASILPRLLAPLRNTAPGVRVRIIASSDMQNLTQREADIAIRHARPEQPDLIARHVGNFRANLYAATSYLDQMGRSKAPRDVAAYDFVGNADPERPMAPLHDIGIPVRTERFVVSSESGVVAWELTKAGYGASLQPEILGDEEQGIEKVLSELPSLEFPIWLVTHRELQTSRRIRIVFDLLVRGLLEAARKMR